MYILLVFYMWFYSCLETLKALKISKSDLTYRFPEVAIGFWGGGSE